MSKKTFALWFAVAALIFGVAVFDRLPDRIATHFDVHGRPDGWSSRTFAAFFMPVFSVVLVGVFNVLPRILPSREHFAAFEDSYWVIVNLAVAFVCALHVVVLSHALGWPVDVPTAVLLGVGSLFVVLGNVLPRTRSNWFLGIRTPWTLESEHVWRETHRLGGKTFIIGGLITIAAAFMPARQQPWIAMGALMIGAFVPVIYSYFVCRREKQ
jgi:uncharacterized membrane protein